MINKPNLNPSASTTSGINSTNTNAAGVDPTSSHPSSIIPGSATHPSNTTQSDPTKDLSTASSNNFNTSRDRENLTDIPIGGAQSLQSQDTPHPSAPAHQALDLNRESGGATSSSSAGTGAGTAASNTSRDRENLTNLPIGGAQRLQSQDTPTPSAPPNQPLDLNRESGGATSSSSAGTGAGTAASSAGAGNIERASSNAGGIQGTDHRTSAPTPHAVSSAGAGNVEKATENAGGVQGSKSDIEGGPPAQEIKFTQKEIDEAANVYVSHENPHTIGPDGSEEKLEECGGAADDKVEGGKGGKEKVGKLDKIKGKLHLGGKS